MTEGQASLKIQVEERKKRDEEERLVTQVVMNLCTSKGLGCLINKLVLKVPIWHILNH